MIVCHAKKFVILVPWKTASSTLHARFRALNESPYRRLYYFSPHLNRVTHQHIGCAEFATYPEAAFGYTVAAFVRNPYDRVYSGFIQMQRDLETQVQAPFPAAGIRDLVLRQLEDNRTQLAKTDYDFDRWVAGLTEDQILCAGRNTSLPLHPAHYWTHLRGEQYVSFIGKVENFEHDLSSFCHRVGIAVPPPVNHNVSGDTVVPTGGYRYTHIMNKASIEKINDFFQNDFVLFRYRSISFQGGGNG